MGAACKGTLYSECVSSFPTPVCTPQGAPYVCTWNAACGTRMDFTVSNVRVPVGAISWRPSLRLESADQTPVNERRDSLDIAPDIQLPAIDSLCWERLLSDVFVEQARRFRDAGVWGFGRSNTPWMHFGAADGTFITSPARSMESCGWYDPRSAHPKPPI